MRVRRPDCGIPSNYSSRVPDSVQNEGNCGCCVRRVDKQPLTVSSIVPGTPLAALNLVPRRHLVPRDVGDAAVDSTPVLFLIRHNRLDVHKAHVSPSSHLPP
jgi:hypothetical protein